MSLVEGIVNITGVLSVKTLTTNVTGHFAYFSEELSNKNYQSAVIYLLFIFSFLDGVFVSIYLVEIISTIKPQIPCAVNMIIEIIILSIAGIFRSSSVLSNINGQVIAFTLLFETGLQNSLVTKAPQSGVRTTHLAGLFTDLGIELSQLFFYSKTIEAQQLSKSIWLKLAFIGCFFLGCIAGGLIFRT